jgi:phosphoribosylcarboxyaminoimidazole (NCAIR) mutase
VLIQGSCNKLHTTFKRWEAASVLSVLDKASVISAKRTYQDMDKKRRKNEKNKREIKTT